MACVPPDKIDNKQQHKSGQKFQVQLVLRSKNSFLIFILFGLIKISLNGNIPQYKDQAYFKVLCYIISQQSYIIHTCFR